MKVFFIFSPPITKIIFIFDFFTMLVLAQELKIHRKLYGIKDILFEIWFFVTQLLKKTFTFG
jgi:hypothetical protein